MGMDNVLAVQFREDSSAYEALSVLKELDGQQQVRLAGAAVVLRSEDGQIAIKDEVADTGYSGTATGGIIGLLVGILGGPFGVLIGGATGLLVGSLFDMDDAEETESALSAISRSRLKACAEKKRMGVPGVISRRRLQSSMAVPSM